jgi:hypothetical protein
MDRTFYTAVILTTLSVVTLLGTACGGDDEAPLQDRLTAQAGSPSAQTSSPAPQTSPQTAPTAAPTVAVAPTLDPATSLQVRSLGRLILGPDDVPGFDTLNNQEASRQQIIDAQSGIPELQQALEASDLLGAWAALYSNPEPPGTFISSVAYLFESPQGAASLVEATRNIEVADYLGALEAAEEPAAPVGEASVLMRFRTPDGYAYELTWAQGPAAGQVLVRYVDEPPADARDVVQALAQIQAQRMATFVP